MANPIRVRLPPALASAAAAAGKSPIAVVATGAAKEIHNSGDWRQGTRAGSHEKSSDYAQRILTEMPLHDALRVYDHDCFDYLDRATDVKQKRARGDLGLFAAIARVKQENGESWLKARLDQNVASFCARKPDRAAALEGLGKRLQRSLVIGVKVNPHMGRTPSSGVKRKASQPPLPQPQLLPLQPQADEALGELQLVDVSPLPPPSVSLPVEPNEVPSPAPAMTAPAVAIVGGSFRAAERNRKKKRPSTTTLELPLDPPVLPLRKAGRPKKGTARRAPHWHQPEADSGPSEPMDEALDVQDTAPVETVDADMYTRIARHQAAMAAGKSFAAEGDKGMEWLRWRVCQLEEVAAANEARAVVAEATLERIKRALVDAT